MNFKRLVIIIDDFVFFTFCLQRQKVKRKNAVDPHLR